MRGFENAWHVDPACPECGGECEYNGNYFCSEPECDWALEDLHDPERVPNREAWAWYADAYESLMRIRGVAPDAEFLAEARLQGDAEFWALNPTNDEIAGALKHLVIMYT